MNMNLYYSERDVYNIPKTKAPEAKASISKFEKLSFHLWRDLIEYPYGKRTEAKIAYQKYLADNSISKEQQGNKPMSYCDDFNPYSSFTTKANYTTSAAVAVCAPVKSDIAIQREYLLGRLETASRTKRTELETLFNLFVDNEPKGAADLIDRITNKKYTLDDAKIAKAKRDRDHELDRSYDDDCGCYEYTSGLFYGLTWEGPKPDKNGYNLAIIERDKQYNIAKDAIMIFDPVTAATALKTFEDWKPASKLS